MFLFPATFFGLLLILCIVRSFFAKKHIASVVRRLLVTIFIPLAANFIIVIPNGRFFNLLGYFGYFIGTDFMLYYLISFSMEYCDFKFKGTLAQKILCVVILCDVVSILLNPLFCHVFDITPIALEADYIYYSLVSFTFHKIHLIISYIMVFISFGIFIYKIIIANKFYLEKYIVVLLCMTVVAVFEGYYILSNTPIDMSMIAYAVSGSLVYYFSVEYLPFFLKNKMMSVLITDDSAAMFFMDDKDRCIFINKAAAKMLDIKVNDFAGAKKKFFGLFEDTSVFDNDNFELNDYNPANTDVYLDVRFSKVFDTKHVYTGFYATVKDRTAVVKKHQREQYLASHDNLTDFYTRDYFFHEVESRLAKDKDDYLVIGLDMKDFKLVNSIYGKHSGDNILQKMAFVIKEISGKHSIYGRIYGDRFGILMRKHDFDEEKLINSFEGFVHKERDEEFPIVTYFGIYEVVDRSLSASVMFDRAFLAVSSIKNDVQKRVAYYDENLKNSRVWEKIIIFSLDNAIASGQIVPFLQPQVDHNGKLLGAEMLVRWIHPEYGLIPPVKFIDILEKNGLILKLDYYMWEQACVILRKWKDAGITDLHLSVNISPKDFYFIDIYDAISKLADKYDVPHSLLKLEITETVVMSDFNRKLPVIQNLRNDGFVIEMDDFGSGYSSLNMLKDMPVDILKLDMVFLQKTTNIERVRIILRFLIDMAIHLNVSVIAEGVESKDQVEFLHGFGCNIFQGYHFSKPVGLVEFENLYKDIFK